MLQTSKRGELRRAKREAQHAKPKYKLGTHFLKVRYKDKLVKSLAGVEYTKKVPMIDVYELEKQDIKISRNK